MPARSGDTVTVHYRGMLEDGTVFDASEGRAPLLFTLGEGDVIPGFEAAVLGLEVGEKAVATIPPEEAYGPRYEEAVQEVPIDLFGEAAPEIGDVVSVIADDGSQLAATVSAISDDLMTVTLDFNHPLAGRTLTFEIELVEIVER
ncbi:peptidylprolyl isomerase [Coriobacteriia bacterium Es71-Z0120]|uniref:FKBP-type peptidyl-prolyl cis-trans isomerase n=1 Tax=Parvivirga hydrogeniphila TaxID=2939460 RepID=UPI0022608EB6|nr:peptidylprolyl isomerase [Parvivirga hydrogeniphila]MCL4079391.1 peptidylprolyl isomerase [Parvivirga hydrogeniphila]